METYIGNEFDLYDELQRAFDWFKSGFFTIDEYEFILDAVLRS